MFMLLVKIMSRNTFKMLLILTYNVLYVKSPWFVNDVISVSIYAVQLLKTHVFSHFLKVENLGKAVNVIDSFVFQHISSKPSSKSPYAFCTHWSGSKMTCVSPTQK